MEVGGGHVPERGRFALLLPARALEMTGAIVPKAMLVMMMTVVHQEEASPPEKLHFQL